MEDEGRSKCEFTMIVAYRKSQFKTDSRQKKKTKLCGETELNNFIREINKLNKRKENNTTN